MNLPASEHDFLRALVKTSRQRPHHVRWQDRDGSERITTLSPADAARLTALAQSLRLGRETLLREAAHLPPADRPPATSD